MIIKSFEINKIKLDKNKFILLYGQNNGSQKETLKNLIKSKKGVFNYDEKEILDDSDSFLEQIISRSLFEEEKTIIINRATDKILKIIEEIDLKKIDDLKIIILANNLEKRSKLRVFFEKHKIYLCIPFYPDNKQTLSKIAYNFFRENKIITSSENINLIINKCNGDREILQNELIKIKHFSKNRKNITRDDISKLTNLIENISISELADNCLAKNNKKIVSIFNENNFSNDDSIIIIRTLLNKSKKILQLSEEFKNKKNIELVISSAKPPIFWKDKEITKQQIYKWSPENIKNLIYKLSNLEFFSKKNLNNSLKLVSDFIIEVSLSKTNS
mgnify:FL=1